MMGRHSRRVPGAATLPPQVAILERDTFQTDTFGAGECKVETRHVPEWDTRVGDYAKDGRIELSASG